MSRSPAFMSCLLASLLVITPAALAAPGPESPPIDWRDFVDHDGDGDHVVGEEMCAQPAQNHLSS